MHDLTFYKDYRYTHSHTRLLNKERKQTWSQWRWRCGDLTFLYLWVRLYWNGCSPYSTYRTKWPWLHSNLPRNMYLWVYVNTNMPYPRNTFTLTFTTLKAKQKVQWHCIHFQMYKGQIRHEVLHSHATHKCTLMNVNIGKAISVNWMSQMNPHSQ